MAVLRIEITTSKCEEGTAYIHRIEVKEDKGASDMMHDALDAVETLYGDEEVISVLIEVEDD